MEMAYKDAKELVFGRAKKPLSYEFDIEVGKGSVIPEIKYWPNRGAEGNEEKLRKEFERITIDLLESSRSRGLAHFSLRRN
ncbi:MAG: hypothetical protein J7L11_02145 [Thermoprotei archaeon]|nr:hypothetical protein [Thermoprotei archaeon]